MMVLMIHTHTHKYTDIPHTLLHLSVILVNENNGSELTCWEAFVLRLDAWLEVCCLFTSSLRSIWTITFCKRNLKMKRNYNMFMGWTYRQNWWIKSVKNWKTRQGSMMKSKTFLGLFKSGKKSSFNMYRV